MGKKLEIRKERSRGDQIQRTQGTFNCSSPIPPFVLPLSPPVQKNSKNYQHIQLFKANEKQKLTNYLTGGRTVQQGKMEKGGKTV